MRSQLSRIPGEERKFRRRRIVAVVPACRRERESAASQAVFEEGAPSPGVEVGSIPGAVVGEGRGVAFNGSGFVAVGDGKACVGAGAMASVADGSAIGVDVSEGEVEVARTATGFAAGAAEGVAAAVSLGEDTVDEVVEGGEAGLRSKSKKRINRVIATISLKMS